IPINASNYITIIIEFDGIDADKAIKMLDDYDLEPIKRLEYTFNGYIVKIKADQIERLEEENIIKNIFYDEPIRIKKNEQSNLELIGIDDYVRYNGMNVTGKGVTVALIDTGVDYTHNDLRDVKGYDFLDKDNDPRDVDGHGTMVAGIIAANGAIRGVAPDVDIIAYRIASGDRYISTSEMITAIEKAAEDQADILNISIGLDHINESIDRAVNNLVDKGIIVVVAAGNDGEAGFETIKSPGSAMKAITVGATLNNIQEPLFATLKVIGHEELIFHPIPMEDTVYASEPIRSELVFVNYATEDDVKDLILEGKIALAERGGPIKVTNGMEERELVYFSDKEYNVANKGAAAIIVYNNEEGLFRGKLIHEANKPDYKPTIPAVSLPREEGLLLKQLLEKEKRVIVELKVYSDPNIIAEFSAKGPVSAFYMKPDLVAPGVMINSTFINNSYNLSTGTSFAAPHVSGAAALLLQLHPNLKPEEVASILVTTADPLIDPFGNYYSFDVAGAGRLNVTKAINSNIIAEPYYAILHVSPNTNASKIIELRSIEEPIDIVNVTAEFFMFDNLPISEYKPVIDLDWKRIGDNIQLIINATANNTIEGRYQGRIYIDTNEERISIPLIVYSSKVNINAENEDGLIKLSLDLNEEWESAKVKIINPENNFKQVLTLTPTKNTLNIRADAKGEHWIDVSIIGSNGITNAFTTLYVNSANRYDSNMIYFVDDIIPLKESLIIIGFLAVISVIVLIIKNKHRKEKSIIDDFTDIH
ncbi:MAG: hypothetical protein D6752_01050, partial [Candidatus Nitrosothermus koennekii]